MKFEVAQGSIFLSIIFKSLGNYWTNSYYWSNNFQK